LRQRGQISNLHVLEQHAEPKKMPSEARPALFLASLLFVRSA